MSETATAAPAKKGFSLFKPLLGGGAALVAGVVGMYSTAIVNTVAKPARPVANFAVDADGLNVSCRNHASGESGWWDFGDGTPLEPFDAGQEKLTHCYAKPGNYSVKLTVRNFLSEENERSVPVDVQKAAAAVAASAPTITGFTVEPLGGNTAAPAGFRIRGEVKNAERVIWDMGGEKLEVTDSPGVFDKMVVFERPGSFPIQLTGLSDRTAVKQATMVTVAAPRSGSLAVLVRTIDSGTRVERREVPETVTLPLPAKGTKAMAFEKVVSPRPGFDVVEAKLARPASGAVKNVKVEVAADRKTAKVTGEFTAVADGSSKAGGSDPMIPLVLTVEKATAVTLSPNSVAMPLTPDATGHGHMSAVLAMPPAPLGMPTANRKIDFELREVAADGRVSVQGALADLKLPMKGTIHTLNKAEYVISAQQVADGKVRFTLTPVATR